jgi:hypothetical protein
MYFTYTEIDVQIFPFEDRRTVRVLKPHKDISGRRHEARIQWFRHINAHPYDAYRVAQAMFVAAGLADVFNLTTDLEVVKKFGVETVESNEFGFSEQPPPE